MQNITSLYAKTHIVGWWSVAVVMIAKNVLVPLALALLLDGPPSGMSSRNGGGMPDTK